MTDEAGLLTEAKARSPILASFGHSASIVRVPLKLPKLNALVPMEVSNGISPPNVTDEAGLLADKKA